MMVCCAVFTSMSASKMVPVSTPYVTVVSASVLLGSSCGQVVSSKTITCSGSWTVASHGRPRPQSSKAGGLGAERVRRRNVCTLTAPPGPVSCAVPGRERLVGDGDCVRRSDLDAAGRGERVRYAGALGPRERRSLRPAAARDGVVGDGLVNGGRAAERVRVAGAGEQRERRDRRGDSKPVVREPHARDARPREGGRSIDVDSARPARRALRHVMARSVSSARHSRALRLACRRGSSRPGSCPRRARSRLGRPRTQRPRRRTRADHVGRTRACQRVRAAPAWARSRPASGADSIISRCKHP